METLKWLGNWALILSLSPHSLYEQFCFKSKISAGWCSNICYCWNKMICLIFLLLLFSSLHILLISASVDLFFTSIIINMAPLQGEGSQGCGVLCWARRGCFGAGLVSPDRAVWLGPPGCSTSRARAQMCCSPACSCETKKFPGYGLSAAEVLGSPYGIRTTQIIFLVVCSQNVCRQITIF